MTVVDHLRKGLPCRPNVCRVMEAAEGCTCVQAADEIDQLRTVLRMAVRLAESGGHRPGHRQPACPTCDFLEQAREALR